MRVVSEGPIRINRQTIEAAWKHREPGVRRVIRDATCRGLALVVNPGGMTWRLDWRPRGIDPATGRRWPMQSVTIGAPESHSPDAARDAAGALKARARTGEDLAAERRQQLAEANRRRASTVERLFAAYEADLPRRPKLRGAGPISPPSARAELAHVRRAIATMGIGERAVVEVSAQDIGKLLAAEARRPATARKHFGALSRFLDWAVEQGHLALNPCATLPKARRPRPVASRAHCPSLANLAAIWRAADALPGPERDLVRLLIAIPCRLREATRLDWAHLDLQAAVWSLPAAMTKTREPHRFHLHPLALALLRERHAAAGAPRTGLVLPGVRSGQPIEGFSKMKARLARASGLEGWVFHDFRRSFASACPSLGVQEAVADAVLSHRQSATRGGVLGVYQRSSRWPEQVQALNAWGAALSAAIG